MPFTANPFDFTGTLDTTGYGLKSGETEPTGGADQANTDASAVCPAFHDASLAADAANRVLPTQRSLNRTY